LSGEKDNLAEIRERGIDFPYVVQSPVARNTYQGKLMPDISHILSSHGEDWEVVRGGQVVGTFRGMRNPKLKNVGFGPNADIRAGDVVAGKICKLTLQINEVDPGVADGEVFCFYALYGEKAGKSGGHTIHINNPVGSAFMLDSPGATQTVNFTAESAEDLKVLVRGLLGALDELGLSEQDKEAVKEDAEYLKKKLDSGKPEPSLVRECLKGIKKKLVDAASAAASSKIVTQAKYYGGLIADYLCKNYPL
jgi:hypothetical protein